MKNVMTAISSEIYWLILAATLTDSLSIIYVLNIIVRQWPKKGLHIDLSASGSGYIKA